MKENSRADLNPYDCPARILQQQKKFFWYSSMSQKANVVYLIWTTQIKIA